jgi:hypothetical protein
VKDQPRFGHVHAKVIARGEIYEILGEGRCPAALWRPRASPAYARGQFDLIALGEQPLANAIRERSK